MDQLIKEILRVIQQPGTRENLENSITVLGDKGYFKISGKNLNEYSNSLMKKPKKFNLDNLFVEFYRKVFQTLYKKEINHFSAHSARKSLEIITAIYQSLKLQKEIKFPISKKIKIKLGE